jgi:hypothetical protein
MGGLDGRVSPRTGASERIVLPHYTGTRVSCVPSGEVVHSGSRTTVSVPTQ